MAVLSGNCRSSENVSKGRINTCAKKETHFQTDIKTKTKEIGDWQKGSQ